MTSKPNRSISAVRLEKRVSGGGGTSGGAGGGGGGGSGGGNSMRKPQKRKEPREQSSHESEFDDWDNRESVGNTDWVEC